MQLIRRTSVSLLSAAIIAACSLATPEAPEHHHEHGRATSHRTFDDVEHWKSVFDKPERADWQKPAQVIEALRLKRGQVVADLGAGTGYFVPHLAGAVGTEGTVYAVEVEPNLVAHIRERAEQEKLPQVVPVLTSKDHPRLPRGGVDLVMIVDTYHHLDYRAEYLAKLAEALTPLGRIAVIDWKKEPLPEGPKPDHKLRREQVEAEVTAAGYELIDSPDFLPYQYFLIFRKSAATTWGAGTGAPRP